MTTMMTMTMMAISRMSQAPKVAACLTTVAVIAVMAATFASAGLAHGLGPIAQNQKSDAGAHVPSETMGSISIAASTAERFARSGAVRGVPAKDASGTIMGLAVSGVSGSGLRDGDIVVSIEGVPMTSVGAAVGVIVSALAEGKPQVRGIILRKKQRFAVVVAVPHS
jgi:hypothetical protein